MGNKTGERVSLQEKHNRRWQVSPLVCATGSTHACIAEHLLFTAWTWSSSPHAYQWPTETLQSTWSCRGLGLECLVKHHHVASYKATSGYRLIGHTITGIRESEAGVAPPQVTPHHLQESSRQCINCLQDHTSKLTFTSTIS